MIKRIVIIAVIGIVCSLILFMGLKGQPVNSLIRPMVDEEESIYKLEVLYGGETVEVEVGVKAEKLTNEELEVYFDEAYKLLIKRLLGNNISSEDIRGNLELVSGIPEYGMTVKWYIENEAYVDYEGKIYPDKEAVHTELVATMSYMGGYIHSDNDVSKEYKIELLIQPEEKNERELLEDKIKASIDLADKIHEYDDAIILPQYIDGKEISYTSKSSQEYLGVLLIIAGVPLCLYAGKKNEANEKQRKRKELMLRDYPEIIIKLSLLTGAGMTPYNAFVKITEDYKKLLKLKNKRSASRPAYEEISNMVKSIESGLSEREAYAGFGVRFGLHEYIKLGALLEQNMIKGNEQLRVVFREEVRYAFEERKARAKRLGEAASTKLLMPMMMLLIIVFVVIIVPAFMSF